MGWPGPVTLRQEEAFHAWLDMQWNIPSRADYYAMQAAWIHCKQGTKLSELLLKFEEPRAQARDPESIKRQEETNRYALLAYFGIKPPEGHPEMDKQETADSRDGQLSSEP